MAKRKKRIYMSTDPGRQRREGSGETGFFSSGSNTPFLKIPAEESKPTLIFVI